MTTPAADHGTPPCHESAASADTSLKPDYYHDIILLGKTGLGKSTLGNKLLQVPLPESFSTNQDSTKFPGFCISSAYDDQIQSSYEKCKLETNEDSKMRVLDTPGFSPEDIEPDKTVYETNLKIARWIVCEQLKNDMRVQRVLYFLPERGAPGKADSSLQEELKVIYRYFGIDAFNHMIVIATVKIQYQSEGFPEENYEQIREAFSEAVVKVTGSELTTSPPVVYIGLNDDDDCVSKKIKAAKPQAKDEVFLSVPPCEPSDRHCSRCSSKIRCIAGTKPMPVGVVSQETGELEQYEESKCHPPFVPKPTSKAATFVAHGLEALGGPGQAGSDELLCPMDKCRRAYYSQGCCPVLRDVKIHKKTMEVDHELI